MTMSLQYPAVTLGRRAIRPVVVADTQVPAITRAAFCLFVFSIPFELPRVDLPLEIPSLTGLLFLVSTLFSVRTCYAKLPFALVLFTISTWVLAISAVANQIEHVNQAVYLIGLRVLLLPLFWAMVNVLRDRRVVRGLVIALVAAVALRAGLQLLGIGATSYTVWTGGSRVTMWGQNANLSAMILAAGVSAAVGLLMAPASWLPKIGLFAIPLAGMMAVAIIQGGSRGGIICAVLGLGVFLFSGRTPRARLASITVGVLALLALAWGVGRSAMLRSRFEDSAQHSNFAGREKIYPAVISMMIERPILGWGPWDNQYEIARRIQDRRFQSRDAHNLVGDLMTTSGMIGTLPFLAGLALCIGGAWRARRGPLGLLPLGLLAAVLFGTMSGSWSTAKILWLVLAFGLAAGLWWSTPELGDRRYDPCAA